MANLTPTTHATWIPDVWPDELSDATMATIVLADLVDTSYNETLKFGDTVKIAGQTNPEVQFKTPGTPATFVADTETNQDLTVSKHAYVAYLVEDITEIQSKYDVRKTYSDRAAYSLMATAEGDITNGLTSLPDNFSQAVGTLGSDPTWDDLVEADRLLNAGDVPMSDRFIYGSPSFKAACLKMNQLTHGDFVGDDSKRAVREAYIGKILSAPVYISSLADNNPAAASQSYAWFCHKRGVAMVTQRAPTVHAQYILADLGEGIIVDMIYDFVERLIPTSALGTVASDDRFNVAIKCA